MEKYLGNYRPTKKGSPHPSIPADIPLSVSEIVCLRNQNILMRIELFS